MTAVCEICDKFEVWMRQVAQRLNSAKIHSGSVKNDSSVPILKHFAGVEMETGKQQFGRAKWHRGFILQRSTVDLQRMTAVCEICDTFEHWMRQVAQMLQSAKIHSGSLKNDSRL